MSNASAGRAAAPPFLADNELRAELVRLGAPVNMSKGDVLFRRGDAVRGIYVIEGGRVMLTAGEGALAVRRVCKEGSLLGLPATMRNRPYSLTAEAISDTTLVFIEADEFSKLMREKPDQCLKVVHMLADEVGSLRRNAFGPLKRRGRNVAAPARRRRVN